MLNSYCVYVVSSIIIILSLMKLHLKSPFLVGSLTSQDRAILVSGGAYICYALVVTQGLFVINNNLDRRQGWHEPKCKQHMPGS